MKSLYVGLALSAALIAPALAAPHENNDPHNKIIQTNIGEGGSATINPGDNQELGGGTLELFFGAEPPAYGWVEFFVWTNKTFSTPCTFAPAIGDGITFWPLGTQLGWAQGPSAAGNDVLYYRASEIPENAHMMVKFVCPPKKRDANH